MGDARERRVTRKRFRVLETGAKRLRAAITRATLPGLRRSTHGVLQEQRKAIAAAIRSGQADWWDGHRWDAALSRALLGPTQLMTVQVRDHMTSVLGPVDTGGKKAIGGYTSGPLKPGQLGPADIDAQRHALTKGSRRITRINEATRAMIRLEVAKGIQAGLSPRDLGDVIEASHAFDEYRAERIATTELQVSYNAAALGSFDELGVALVQCIDGDDDDECIARQAKDNGYGPGIYTLEQAAQEEDHPNGTLDWAPVVDSVGSQPYTSLPKGYDPYVPPPDPYAPKPKPPEPPPPPPPPPMPKPKPPIPEPTDASYQTVEKFERRIAAEERINVPRPGYGGTFGPERGIVVNPSGEIVWEGTGEATSIDVTKVAFGPGDVLTHFHPSHYGGRPQLSLADVRLSLDSGGTVRAFHSTGEWMQVTAREKGLRGLPGNHDFEGWVADFRKTPEGAAMDAEAAYQKVMEDFLGDDVRWEQGKLIEEIPKPSPYGAPLPPLPPPPPLPPVPAALRPPAMSRSIIPPKADTEVARLEAEAGARLDMTLDLHYTYYGKRKDLEITRAKEIVSALEDLQRDYPEAFAKLKLLKMDKLKPRTWADTSLQASLGRDTPNVMRINTLRWGENAMDEVGRPYNLEADLYSNQLRGWIAQGSVRGVMDHEFGHAFMDQHLSAVFGFIQDERAAGVKMVTNISHYADQDVWERFAEMFALARSNLPDARVPDVVVHLRKWLAEKKYLDPGYAFRTKEPYFEVY
jgi:hypothetical protein